MAILGPLAALLGIEVDVLTERIKQNAMVYGLVALFGVICLAFLLVAAHVGLTYWVGPLWAALIIAGAALLVLFVIWLWAGAVERARLRRVAERRRATDSTALVTTAAITALPLLIKNPAIRIAAVPLGFLIGYILLSRYASGGAKGGDKSDPT